MNKRSEEKNLALFIDFDNIALGLKQSNMKKFDISLVLQRLLEKGKIVIKRAYADWSNYTEYKNELHSAGIELPRNTLIPLLSCQAIQTLHLWFPSCGRTTNLCLAWESAIPHPNCLSTTATSLSSMMTWRE
jgi:hypothetical protein